MSGDTLPGLFDLLLDKGGSDLHLTPNYPPMLRLRGELVPALTPEDTHRLIFDTLSDSQRKAFQERLEVDFAFQLDDTLRVRVNAFVQNRGEGAVFRSIPHKIPTFEGLGLPPVMRTLSELDKGLILVTGPTGSGKSTTLAAMIDHVNATTPGHILTLEDQRTLPS